LSRASGNVSAKIEHAIQMVGQVGGLSGHKKTLLSFPPCYILKPLRLDHRGIREIYFYEAAKESIETTENQGHDMFSNATDVSPLIEVLDRFAIWLALRIVLDSYLVDSERRILRSQRVLENQRNLLERLHPFLPEYFGVIEHQQPSASLRLEASGIRKEGSNSYLLLEDITAKYSKPCTIDVKMGKQSYEPDADKEKQERESNKYPQQTEFGLRIVGMRVYDPSHEDACEDGFVFFTKHYGRSLREREKLKDAFIIYFGVGNSERSLSCVISQLRVIEQWFLSNDSFCFYASSLLISYEGETDGDCAQNMAEVKMIDFARVRRQSGGDEGFLLGLKTLTTLLEEILFELNQSL
jgi:1D-myo-inositol-tetrakisphosphate 5-kinase/inositol-polyphosphate multikinase